MSRLTGTLLLFFSLAMCACGSKQSAKWITADNPHANDTSTWVAFRKDCKIDKVPAKAIARIGADSKYWLWINGEPVVFEGGLKRGPNPSDGYFDEIDIAPYLKQGDNKLAVLLWYFGKDGFSHKNSGASGLIFDLNSDGLTLVSDSTWLSRIHPAFRTADNPGPNMRLPESNIRFIAAEDMPGWESMDIDALPGFSASAEKGVWGDAPWNNLVVRPIPQWKDYGVKSVPFEVSVEGDKRVYTARLPYNMQMTPVLTLTDTVGNNEIYIHTDHLYGGSDTNLRAEYVTRAETAPVTYESLGWLNGENIILVLPEDSPVRIDDISYRETGFDSEPAGSFISDNDFYNRFWQKGLRTLYVNMRDSYFDCPDRERAQWWGDAVVLTGESFYAYDPNAHKLMRKAIRELVDWQQPDSTLFSPVPAGNWDKELPAQMLASVGWYGFWNYYLNTGDKATLEYIYPAVKKYLGVWNLDETGLTVQRKGGWTWGDWGNNKDMRLIQAGWHYLALRGAAEMASELGFTDDREKYLLRMDSIAAAYNGCWNGKAYRHPDYKDETDDRVQALAVITGIASPDKYPAILDIFKTQYHASPYMEKYVMEALFDMGCGEFALERTQNRFTPMVDDPERTTLFEDWEPGGSGGGSTNHAWSGGSITVLGRKMCGIEPIEPGYKLFKVEPSPSGFRQASISVPSVAGDIYSSFEIGAGDYRHTLEVPEGTEALLVLPAFVDKTSVTINDQSASDRYNADGHEVPGKTTLLLPPGTHKIAADIIQ